MSGYFKILARSLLGLQRWIVIIMDDLNKQRPYKGALFNTGTARIEN